MQIDGGVECREAGPFDGRQVDAEGKQGEGQVSVGIGLQGAMEVAGLGIECDFGLQACAGRIDDAEPQLASIGLSLTAGSYGSKRQHCQKRSHSSFLAHLGKQGYHKKRRQREWIQFRLLKNI